MNQIQTDSAVEIRNGEELDLLKLETYLVSKIDGFKKINLIKQFPGGFSNLTYLIESEVKDYVLRRAPIGANIKSAHDMGREFKVLSLLQNHYKSVPKVEMFCEDETIIGAQFYLMEKVEGVILRAKNAKKYNLETQKWQHLSEVLIDNLADLHQIDIYQTGLINLGKPEGYVDRQVEGWLARYSKSKTDEIVEMDFVAEWLIKNKPKKQNFAFIHNDYKYDNVVFDINLSEIKAVLDWEMATVGDPLMDLGAVLAYWCQGNENDFAKSMNITWIQGNLNRKQVVERYTQKTGIDITDILFYFVFGLYKNATIVQQIYARWKAGFTNDPRFEGLIFGVKELANMASIAILKKSIY